MTDKTTDNNDLSLPFRGTGEEAGGVRVVPLSEGAFTVDKTKAFVPFDQEKDILNERPVGSLLVEIQPFLVITSKDILLLDTGLGFNTPGGGLQIHENIRKAGYQPEQVTKVLMSHLHKDHASGMANPSQQRFGDGNIMNFPNAKYYVQRRELDFAWRESSSSFLADEIEPLMHSPQVEFMHEDKGVIDDYIFYEHTGAHSPHHQVFWIKDGGETIFFGGDVAPELKQMKIRYKTKYDFEPEKANTLRQQWWEQGNREGWTFLFYHDIKHPIYKGKS